MRVGLNSEELCLKTIKTHKESQRDEKEKEKKKQKYLKGAFAMVASKAGLVVNTVISRKLVN